MSYSVYKHTFPNGKVYIGITSQKPEDRWSKGKGYQRQPLIYNAINKYGWDNIVHKIFLYLFSVYDMIFKENVRRKKLWKESN